MNLSPLPIQKFFANNGRPLVGGKLFTYAAGTTTKIATYTDSGGGTPNTNPIVLDFRGECRLWLDPLLAYKFILAPANDTDPPTSPIWTVDDITVAPQAFDNAAVDVGSVNNISLNIPQIPVLTTFTRVVFLAANTNTGPSTLQINGGTSAPIVWQNSGALGGGEIQQNGMYEAIYDGGSWQLQGPTLLPSLMRTAEEVAASVTPSDYGYPPGDVRRYGAVLNGVIDDTSAFQAAWKLKAPYAPSGSTVITGTIPIIANQQGILDGTVINITGTSVVVFSADTVNDWSLIGRFEIVGDNNSSGSTSGSAMGLNIIDCMRFYVESPVFKNIKGWGIFVQPGSNTANRSEKGVINSPECYACYIGIEIQAGTGAEYVTTVAPYISRCNVGCLVVGGNYNVVGGSISDNTDGIHIDGGSNGDHGTFTGTYINHNAVFAIKATGTAVLNGHWFVGCNMYEGDVWLKDSLGIVFKSCTIDVENYYFEGSTGCGFIDCTLPDAYGNVINNNYNGSPSFTIWQNCKKLDGKNKGYAANILGVRAEANSGGITITPATLAADTTILLADVSNTSANNTTQTLYDGYDASTGIYTCHGLGDGRVRVTVLLNVANNAADDGLPGIYGYLTKNGTTLYRWMTRTRLTTTKTIFAFDGIVEMDPTDTLRLRMGGTVANNITIGATETIAIVEGL
jgi:hypothetical protein